MFEGDSKCNKRFLPLKNSLYSDELSSVPKIDASQVHIDSFNSQTNLFKFVQKKDFLIAFKYRNSAPGETEEAQTKVSRLALLIKQILTIFFHSVVWKFVLKIESIREE